MAEEDVVVDEIDSELCPICWRPLGQIDPVKISGCGHNFHYSCLNQLALNNPNSRMLTCPLCRRYFDINKDLEMYELLKSELIPQLETQKLKLITKLDKKEIQSIQKSLKLLSEAEKHLKTSNLLVMAVIPLEFHEIIYTFYDSEGKELPYLNEKLIVVIEYAKRTIEDYLIEREKRETEREGMSDSEKSLGGGESYSKGGGGKSRKQKRSKGKSRKSRKLRKSRKIKKN